MVRAWVIKQHQHMLLDVLIVDDSDVVRTSLRALLACVAGMGAIREVASLSAALNNVQQDPPNVLILDLHLPDGLASNILPILKHLDPRMRIAMFTFYADDSNRQQCLSLGADAFFDKATQSDALLDLVRLEVQLHLLAATEPIDPNSERKP